MVASLWHGGLLKVGHRQYECTIVCLLDIALLTHASTCPTYSQHRALSLFNLQTHSIFMEPLPQMRGQRECTYSMYVWCEYIVYRMTNHWYYYPKPACYTETVLSKLGGGNSALLTGNQWSPPQSSQTNCFSVTGWFGIIVPVISHSSISSECDTRQSPPQSSVSS